MNQSDDKEILRLFRAIGTKESAFRRLVDQYGKRVYWHIRRMVGSHEDADDLVQEVFIKIWNKLHKFRGESGLYTWIYRIATNETLAFLKKRNKREKNLLNTASWEENIPGSSNEAFSRSEEMQDKFREALRQLPDKQRLVFNLRYFDELSYDDISAITGVTVGGLKASYHHAVKKIEKYATRH